MSDATIYGVPNHFLNSANTLTGGETASSDLAIANLRNSSLSVPVRFRYDTPATTWLRLAIASGQYREVGGVGLVLTNLHRSATRNADTGAVTAVAQLRLRCSRTNFQIRVRPDTLAAATNLDGAVAAVQDLDPEQPDSSWLTATAAGSATAARCTFPTLGGLNLLTGAGLQVFRVAVRKTVAGTGDPVLTIELYESAALKATLTPSKTTGFTSAAGGELVTAAWNASSLTDVTGANLEIRVSGTGVTGTSIEFGAVEQVSDFDFTAAHNHDSAWQTINLPNTLGVLPTNWYYLLPSTMQPDYLQIDISDSTNPDGYVQVGLAVAGPRFAFGVNNVIPGASWSLTDESAVEQTRGGATVGETLKKRRGFNGTWENLTDAQTHDTWFDRMGYYLGVTGGFVFIFDPATAARFPHTAAYARLASPPAPVHPYDDGKTVAVEMLEEVA